MSKKIRIDDLASEIESSLIDYASSIDKDMEKARDRVARKGVTTLKSTSPKRYGKYAQSWGSQKDGKARVIRNRNHYSLTHLLEKGHALRQGGRTRAFPHIKPVEDMVIKEYTKETEKAIRNAKIN